MSVLLFTSGGKGNSPDSKKTSREEKETTQDNKKTLMMGSELELAYF